MPVITTRATLGAATLAVALVLAPLVPAHADSGLPAIGGSAGVLENRPTGLDFLNREATGEILTYAVVTPPRHGTAIIIGPTASTVLYTPGQDFVGDDSFTYTVTDGVFTSAPGVMRLSVVPGGASAPGDPVLSPPRSTAVPPGGLDGDESSRLTISGEDFIDSRPDGHTHVLPVGADIIEGYYRGGGTWLFEDVSRNAYDPVQLSAQLSGAVGPGGGLATGPHRLVPRATAPTGAFSLDLSAFHAACSQQPGTEEVQRFDVAPNGDPVAVDLTFAVTCDADTVHVMTGSLHWRAATGDPSASAPSTPSPSLTPTPSPSPTTPSPSPTSTPPLAPSPSPTASSPTPAPTPTPSPASSPPLAPAPTAGAVGAAPVGAVPAPDAGPSGSPTTAPTPAPDPSKYATPKVRSRTTLARAVRSSGRVRLTVEAEHAVAGTATWARWGAATVRMEERTAHGWRVFATTRTNARGSAAVVMKASKHSWRAVAVGTASIVGSISPARTK